MKKSQLGNDMRALCLLKSHVGTHGHHAAYTRYSVNGTASHIPAKGTEASSKYPRPMYFIPTKQEIADLKEGDLAPDAFGKMSKVVRISYRGTNMHGQDYVGYHTEFGQHGGTMSNSMAEGVLMRHAGLQHTSKETDRIEREMLGER